MPRRSLQLSSVLPSYTPHRNTKVGEESTRSCSLLYLLFHRSILKSHLVETHVSYRLPSRTKRSQRGTWCKVIVPRSLRRVTGVKEDFHVFRSPVGHGCRLTVVVRDSGCNISSLAYFVPLRLERQAAIGYGSLDRIALVSSCERKGGEGRVMYQMIQAPTQGQKNVDRHRWTLRHGGSGLVSQSELDWVPSLVQRQIQLERRRI